MNRFGMWLGVLTAAISLIGASSLGQTEAAQKLELSLESRTAFQADAQTLYYTQGNRVIALDRSTWKQRWVFQSTQALIPKLELDGERLYALTWRGTFAALDARTGRKVWSVQGLKSVREHRGLYGQGLYMQVFASFFVFRKHLVVTQAGELSTWTKDGKLLNASRLADDRGGFLYTVKAFDSDDFYAVSTLAFTFPYLPGWPAVFRATHLFANDTQTIKHAQIDFSDSARMRWLEPFDVRVFGDLVVSTQNPIGIVNDDVVPWEHNKKYFFFVYRFEHPLGQGSPPSRREAAEMFLTSRFANRAWCGARWCEYTETPHDFDALGVFDDRLYFMTDQARQRFAYFDLRQARQVIRSENTPPYHTLSFTASPPAAWLEATQRSLGNVVLEPTSLFATGLPEHYVIADASGALRVVRPSSVTEIEDTRRLTNFIPSRDIEVGTDDVIVRGDDHVWVYKPE